MPRNSGAARPKHGAMPIEILLFISVAGLVLSAMIAGFKNRNALGWGIVGFFFPLIGVIIAIALEPRPDRADPYSID